MNTTGDDQSPEAAVATLFRREVPEIATGVVEIRAVARLAGVRTKIAVTSNDATVDAIAAFVGPKGERVRRVPRQQPFGDAALDETLLALASRLAGLQIDVLFDP